MTRPAERLTRHSPAGGCGCKLGPGDLERLLRSVRQPDSPLLAVGFETRDDAAVFQFDGARSLVFSTDFFTPIVDSADDWGAIAAANALSDIYAMGGSPRMALSIAAWPEDELPLELLADVINAAARVLTSAGAVLAGGHTIRDSSPMFGLAVIGEVPTGRELTNANGRVGDHLILTKPIGVGVIATAIKNGMAPEDVAQGAIHVMSQLNAQASRCAQVLGIRCATDISGFGMLGHTHELASASGLSATISMDSIPLIAGALELADKYLPDGAGRNRQFLSSFIEWRPTGETVRRSLLFDPQTSGGLLLAISPQLVDRYINMLSTHGVLAVDIGRLNSGLAGHIVVDG